jgi:serine-type D-Ala-D-Ala carboxypeptidase (penicillin-binding protein 5/6)
MPTSSLTLKRVLPLLLVLAAFFTAGFGPPTLVDRDVAPTHRLTVGQLRQMQAARLVPEEVTSRAVLIYDVSANETLLAHNADLSLPPASLTKLMTALLILEREDLQAQVIIQPGDLVGGATMGLQAGEALTVEQLLWGLLVPSGNDAAMALARFHSGQGQSFVQRMNGRAQELGLTRSRFENPHGFDADGHLSSALDLLRLSQELWQYPLFREIVGTASTTVAGRQLRSTNHLLGDYPGANGIKTGTTAGAGQSLIARIERDGRAVVIVILGSQDRFADVRRLHAQYLHNYGWRTLALSLRPTALDRLYDPEGNRRFLTTGGEAPSIFLSRWEQARLQPFRRLHTPFPNDWSAGSEVGVLEWRLGDTVVATQPLVLR